MNLIRSILHMGWMLVTVIPWGIGVVLLSLRVRGAPLWWFAVNWMRVVMWGTRVILGVRFQVHGMANLPDGAASPAILLVKHQSTLETLLLPTLMPHPLAFVFKRELLKIPFFGWSMARLDMIHIDRESRAQALKHVVSQGKTLLGQGVWIIMFPEGTRMARGEKGTYQTAGTRLAVDGGYRSAGDSDRGGVSPLLAAQGFYQVARCCGRVDRAANRQRWPRTQSADARGGGLD